MDNDQTTDPLAGLDDAALSTSNAAIEREKHEREQRATEGQAPPASDVATPPAEPAIETKTTELSEDWPRMRDSWKDRDFAGHPELPTGEFAATPAIVVGEDGVERPRHEMLDTHATVLELTREVDGQRVKTTEAGTFVFVEQ